MCQLLNRHLSPPQNNEIYNLMMSQTLIMYYICPRHKNNHGPPPALGLHVGLPWRPKQPTDENYTHFPHRFPNIHVRPHVPACNYTQYEFPYHSKLFINIKNWCINNIESVWHAMDTLCSTFLVQNLKKWWKYAKIRQKWPKIPKITQKWHILG